MRALLIAALTSCCALAQPPRSEAAQVKVLCSNGLRAVMLDLIPKFERGSHDTVLIDFAPAAVLKLRIDAGEAFDVAILTPAVIDDEIARGRMAASSRAPIARSPLGLAMRAGATKPVMDTVEALTRTLRGAGSVTYATQGASAGPFEAIVEQLGLAAVIKPKLRLRETGAQVGEAVASGAVEFGVIPVSEILPVRGVELAGVFPEVVQSYLLMVAAIASDAREGRGAGDLVRFLLDPTNLSVLEAKGMRRP